MEKIRIAGAGLSGLSAAINLTKAGIRVEVFELNKDCGCRFHGDLQGIENWSYEQDVISHLESMNIKTNFYYRPVHSVIITNIRESVSITTKKPSFFLLKRGSDKDTLDQALKEQAVSLGVKINFNKKLQENEADIIATGPIGKKIFGIDTGVVFKTEMEDTFEMLLDNEMAYKGYSYLIVLDGYACLCTVLFRDFNKVGGCLKKTKEFFVKKYKFDIKNPKTVGGLGHFNIKPTFVKGKSICVGEAAGIQDMLFGFGIRSSLYSGYLAAQSIINHDDYARYYKKIASREFLGKTRASFVNRFFWNKMGNDYWFVMRVLKKTKNHLKLINAAYNYNFLHKLCYPLVYPFNK